MTRKMMMPRESKGRTTTIMEKTKMRMRMKRMMTTRKEVQVSPHPQSDSLLGQPGRGQELTDHRTSEEG
jgi:hypothetical protein